MHCLTQVMSESVASALQILNEAGTRETRLFIRMIDKFFDCLNVKSPLLSKLKRKDSIAPYTSPSDERFKVMTRKKRLRVPVYNTNSVATRRLCWLPPAVARTS